MDVAIKKVTERDGEDRFVLVNIQTREVLTVHDASEKTLRRYFTERGASPQLLDRCFERARKRFQQPRASSKVAVNQTSDTMGDDDLLIELGLADDE